VDQGLKLNRALHLTTGGIQSKLPDLANLSVSEPVTSFAFDRAGSSHMVKRGCNAARGVRPSYADTC
jgi:hypothetical protein